MGPWMTAVLANQVLSQHVTPPLQSTHTEMDVGYTGTTLIGAEVTTPLTSTPWKTAVLANQNVTPPLQSTLTVIAAKYTGTTPNGAEVTTPMTSTQWKTAVLAKMILRRQLRKHPRNYLKSQSRRQP